LGRGVGSGSDTPGDEELVDAEREHLLVAVFVVRADAMANFVGLLFGRFGDVRDDVVALGE
jgi:hypothetical protein